MKFLIERSSNSFPIVAVAGIVALLGFVAMFLIASWDEGWLVAWDEDRIAEEQLRAAAGQLEQGICAGNRIGASKEFARRLVEIRRNHPMYPLHDIAPLLVNEMNFRLTQSNACRKS